MLACTERSIQKYQRVNEKLVNFCLGLAVGRLLEFSYGEVACFNCTILSRNSPTALAIAVVAFLDEPLVALALVVGLLLKLQKCEEKAPP